MDADFPQPGREPVSYTHLDVYKRQPMDIANMVLFLCSDKAGFMTGENLCIDGGMKKQTNRSRGADRKMKKEEQKSEKTQEGIQRAAEMCIRDSHNSRR